MRSFLHALCNWVIADSSSIMSRVFDFVGRNKKAERGSVRNRKELKKSNKDYLNTPMVYFMSFEFGYPGNVKLFSIITILASCCQLQCEADWRAM